ncbi:hypothetical protein M432DRAFT_599041 [Thermoascus aurantiacus ATCC 26904]
MGCRRWPTNLHWNLALFLIIIDIIVVLAPARTKNAEHFCPQGGPPRASGSIPHVCGRRTSYPFTASTFKFQLSLSNPGNAPTSLTQENR